MSEPAGRLPDPQAELEAENANLPGRKVGRDTDPQADLEIEGRT